MSKMSELDMVLQEFHAAAKALIDAADSLRDFYSNFAESVPPDVTPPTSPTITLAQVRGVLAEKSRSGFTIEVRKLIEKHGASKLSEIDPVKYTILLEEAEVLGDG